MRAGPSHDPESHQRPIPFLVDQFPVSTEQVERALGLVLSRAVTSEGHPELAQQSATLLGGALDPAGIDCAVLDAQAMNALILGNAAEARALSDRAYTLRPQDELILEHRSILLEYEGENQQALEIVEEGLRRNRWNSSLEWRRSRLLHRLGRIPEAIQACDAALDINPEGLAIQEWLVKLLHESASAARIPAEEERLRQLRSVVGKNQP
jgi:tetratricopeptide (TPR) repeat protein